MAPQVIIRAPGGMSPVNAFRALWHAANPLPILSRPQNRALLIVQEEMARTAEDVARLLRENPKLFYAGGRLVLSDFSNYPEINVSLFDQQYGPGEAQRVLNEYARIPTTHRFDQNDVHHFAAIFSPHKTT